jgi:hypothetical protein
MPTGGGDDRSRPHTAGAGERLGGRTPGQLGCLRTSLSRRLPPSGPGANGPAQISPATARGANQSQGINWCHRRSGTARPSMTSAPSTVQDPFRHDRPGCGGVETTGEFTRVRRWLHRPSVPERDQKLRRWSLFRLLGKCYVEHAAHSIVAGQQFDCSIGLLRLAADSYDPDASSRAVCLTVARGLPDPSSGLR